MFSLNSKISKFTCPSCGERNRFVRYTDENGNLYPDPMAGRCDRINSCGYWKKIDDNGISLKAIKRSEITYVNYDIDVLVNLSKKMEQTALFAFLSKHFGKDRTKETLDKYRIGGIWDRNKFYDCLPYINYNGEITTIQAKCFDANLHTVYNSWYHAIVNDSFTKEYRKNDKFIRCFFGEHLLKNENYSKIGIVEAAKTAIICDLFYHDYNTVWLAAFNCTGLTEEKLNIFKKVKKPILFIPDASPDGHVYREWKRKATSMLSYATVKVWDRLEKLSPTEREKGIDIADIIIDKIKKL